MIKIVMGSLIEKAWLSVPTSDELWTAMDGFIAGTIRVLLTMILLFPIHAPVLFSLRSRKSTRNPRGTKHFYEPRYRSVSYVDPSA